VPHGHSAVGRIKSMKNSNGPIGNRNRDLPACSTVLQPTTPPYAPESNVPYLIPPPVFLFNLGEESLT
jgi:hypothetical protein